MAVGPASAMAPPPMLALDGVETRRAYRAADPGPATALGLLADLRRQLVDAGFEVVFTCEARTCGGFDFRRAMPVLPMPDMYVDLGAYGYLAARRDGPEGASAPPTDLASVLVSQSATGAYAQLTLIAAAAEDPADPEPDAAAAAPNAVADASDPGPWTAEAVVAAFAASGRLVLEGTDFAPGSAAIVGAPAPRLRALAAYLTADRRRRVVLVGHSDWTGGVDANVALSRRRAASVAALLTGQLGVDRAQIRAEGAGPFAPRAANADAEGREANRRVEAVALPDAP